MCPPEDHPGQQPTETLQVGPSRPALFDRAPSQWRRATGGFLAFVVGVAAGVGAVLSWQARPAPRPFRVDEHAVELALFEAARPGTHASGRGSEDGPLRVHGAFLLLGAVSSTVLTISSSDPSLDVRARALPVRVSPPTRFRSVVLEITVRDCEAEGRWTPVDRPFTITWRDQHGRVHLDRAGDFDRSAARSLVRYVGAVCPGRGG